VSLFLVLILFNYSDDFFALAVATTLLFAVVVLGLTAHFTSTTNTYLLLTYDFAALAIATSAITIVSIPVMYVFWSCCDATCAKFSFHRLIVDFLRTGAFTSMVIVELIWLCACYNIFVTRALWTDIRLLVVIWVLWLSTAADTAWFFSVAFRNSCGYIDQIVNTACHEVQAIQAFGFLAWIIRKLILFCSKLVL
jgi:hypothetical protein